MGEVDRLADDRGIDDREALAALAESFATRVPPVIEQDEASIPARIVSMFEFIQTRDQPSKVRVFTPSVESHGYEGGGSVVEVCTADSPFLLDSITNEIERHDVKVAGVVHPVLGVERDAGGRLRAIRHARHSMSRESVEHYQLETVLDQATAEAVEAGVSGVLGDVGAAVADFHLMRAKLDRMIELTRIGGSAYSQEEVDEGVALLQWLDDDNFVFLGYREYRLIGEGEERSVQVVPGTGLGILAEDSRSTVREPVPLKDLPADRAARYREGDLVVVTKTNRRSPVHRTAKMDYIGVRVMGPDGQTAGEARMVGLFTSKAYMQQASDIPMLRRKLHDILIAEDLIEGSHDHKAMIELFETFSKHDLFASSTEELLGVLGGLLKLQERDHVKLFIRPDTLHRSVSILVALPRDRFNADLRRELQDMFLEEFGGTSIDYHLALGEADPAQIHFTVWVPEVTDYDFQRLESRVVSMTRSWEERLFGTLTTRVDKPTARELARKWAGRFPDYYSASTPIEIAATDMIKVDALDRSGAGMSVGLQNESPGRGEQLTRIALYRAGGKRPLSELLPALEDLGLTVVEEIPSRISGPGDYFIHDFGVLRPDGSQIDVEASSQRIVDTLEAAWGRGAESDDLNRLVVSTSLEPRDVEILRAYRTYWRRVAPIFTLAYVNDTLSAHPRLSELLVDLFTERFDPDRDGGRYSEVRNAVLAGLDLIPSIEEDRILRAFLELIEATVRTNFYQEDRPALAFKLISKAVPDAPLPHPLYEIFVLGPTVEGIHLRGGMVARGGLRWSTRREDYRVEVLDLMKAQMTKNAVIVPTGAKGGFVLRMPPDDPAELRADVEAQYRIFIGALLDVTDNRVAGEIVRPPRVRAHDGDDPYLVVAADKGTATFSDVANSIATARGFWLGDAFASGGSTGYDHKALGITARGAWQSLERHFAELGIDPFGETFTVVGVGDMSGDVFGNGLLGSNQMRLVAAFDHRHIFLDPDPDAEQSFVERRRLFELSRSSWDDYDRGLISEGGGLFARTEKSITISEPARRAIGASTNAFTPSQLISAILKAPADLLWNGGIGTYVKASSETHQQVGDRTNDAVRVDGSQLRCRAVVEGGNLGLTQRARIEFAENGGKINTDFIDNSGGVDCSDREVNLKILLDGQVVAGGMSSDERNALIAEVSQEVVDRILADNFHQAQAISREVEVSPRRMYAYEDLMQLLEVEGILDRHIDAMPSSEAMSERMKAGVGLSRPEMSVLLANAKRSIKRALVSSDLTNDPYLVADVERYFPAAVASRVGGEVAGHPLRRELIATLVANDVVNSEGVVFVSRLVTQTGAEPVDVIRAYRIARDLTGARERWSRIEDLYTDVDSELWARLMRHTDRMVASVTRWYLANGNGLGIGDIVEAGRPVFEEMEAGALDSEVAGWRDSRIGMMGELIAAGVPDDVARSHALLPILNYGPDVIEIAGQTGQTPTDTLHAFLQVGQAFGLDRITDWARSRQIDDRWDRWALWTIEEELLMVRRRAVERAFTDAGDRTGVAAVDAFCANRAAHIARLVRFMRQIDTSGDVDMAQLMVAIRQARAAIA
jgi:glutamate dehydrogenase